MLTFRNTNIFFLALLISLIGLDILYPIPLFVYPLLFFAYSGILFYGCYFVHSNFFLPVICSGPPTRRQIALSFDDGPAIAYTSEILEILKKGLPLKK